MSAPLRKSDHAWGSTTAIVSRRSVKPPASDGSLSAQPPLALEKVLEEIGLTARWEARGEARGEKKGKLEVAKNLLNRSLSVEDVADATGLKLEVVRELVQK
jgi:hypothetical protein